MKYTPEQAIDTLIHLHGDVRETNDAVLDASKQLHLILLNLQIQTAHLHEVNGIGVIAQELQKVVELMKHRIEHTKSHRQELLDVEKDIVKYLGDVQQYAITERGRSQ